MSFVVVGDHIVSKAYVNNGFVAAPLRVLGMGKHALFSKYSLCQLTNQLTNKTGATITLRIGSTNGYS
jgi:hypothetical protein